MDFRCGRSEKSGHNSSVAELGNEVAVWQVLADLRGSPVQLPEWWTIERAALHRWLELKSRELASIYQAGVLMVMIPSFPGRVRFVAHAIRELGNRLPDAVAGPTGSTRAEYRQLAGRIHAQWEKEGLPKDGSIPSAMSSASQIGGTERYVISAELFATVAKLVTDHVSGTERNKEKARRLFETIGESNPVPSYLVRNWVKETGWAVQFAHVRNEPLPPDAEDQVTDRFIAFEGSLLALSKRSYENLDALDQLLKDANAR